MRVGIGWAQALQTVDADSAVRYVLSCRKSDGAFGPAAQRYSEPEAASASRTAPATSRRAALEPPAKVQDSKSGGSAGAPNQYLAR